jgi:hypothetical protein
MTGTLSKRTRRPRGSLPRMPRGTVVGTVGIECVPRLLSAHCSGDNKLPEGTMSRPVSCFALFSALALVSGQSIAVIVNEPSGIEATGRVDLDSFGPLPVLSNTVRNVLTSPFPQSVVGVSDASAGLYSYSASSDIGTLALRAAGSLTNSTSEQYFGRGVPILQASAQARDIVTLTSSVIGTFPITLELIVSGTLTPSSTSGFVAANSSLLFGVSGQLTGSDSSRYTDAGPISETLSVTRNVTFRSAGASVDMNFDTFLSVSILGVLPGETVSANLNNTALLNLVLPSEVSVTGSVSGTYGVPIPVPVPEPETYALLLAGLGLVAAAVRRRRRAIA